MGQIECSVHKRTFAWCPYPVFWSRGTILTKFPALALEDSTICRFCSTCVWERIEIRMSWCYSGSHWFADLQVLRFFAPKNADVQITQTRCWSDPQICIVATSRRCYRPFDLASAWSANLRRFQGGVPCIYICVYVYRTREIGYMYVYVYAYILL